MYNRVSVPIYIIMIAATFLTGCATVETNLKSQTVFFISPDGSDIAAGTIDRPWQTLEKARDHIRRINNSMNGDIVVYLRGGTYRLDKTFRLSPQDSGTNGHSIIYRSYKDEAPVISGAVRVTGWKRHTDKIWQAGLDRDYKLRALYVNGKRATMASMPDGVIGQGGYGTFTVTGTEPWAACSGSEFSGIKFNSDEVPVFSDPHNVELYQSNVWSEPVVCVESMFLEDGFTVATLQQPYGAIALNMKWIPFHADPRPDRLLHIRNAYELLDEPGEFYFNDRTHTLYYYSRGENMNKADVYAPAVEVLVSITGNSTTDRVSGVEFYGLTFAYDDYLLSSLGDGRGWVSVQSLSQFTRYIEGGNWHPNRYNDITIPKGTVNLCNAESIRLIRNRFEHLASAVSVNLENDVVDTDITGNYFNDLMGTSVNVGHPQHYEIGDGEQFSEQAEGVCKDIVVSNNYVRNACLDFRQVEAMTGFFTENVKILHNDISGTPYGGIALGWWWGNAGIPPSTVSKNNSICYNRVGSTHTALNDGGVIYVLGEQPDSEIAYNYCYNGPRCIYPDDGSAYWHIHDNVILNKEPESDDQKGLWLHIWVDRCHDMTIENNFVKSGNIRNEGTDIKLINNVVEPNAPKWSKQAQAVIDNSGLEPAYRDIIPNSKQK